MVVPWIVGIFIAGLAVFCLFIRQPLIVGGRPKDSSGHFHKQQVVKKHRRQQTASECHKIEIQDTEAWIMILEFSQSRWSLNTDLHKLDVFNIHEMVFELSPRFNAPVVTFARKCWEWF